MYKHCFVLLLCRIIVLINKSGCVARAVVQTPLSFIDRLPHPNRKNYGAEIFRKCCPPKTPPPPAPKCHMAIVMRPMSCVTCHVSCVTCHVSHFTCHISHIKCHVLCVRCHVKLYCSFFIQSC